MFINSDDDRGPLGKMDSAKSITIKVVTPPQNEDTLTAIKRPLLIDDATASLKGLEYSLKMNPRSHKQLLLEGSNSRMTLRATTAEAERKTPFTYVIGILDDEKEEIELMPATLFHQKRIIKALEKEEEMILLSASSSSSSTTSAKNSLESGEYLKSRLLLGESFGTRKTKAMLHSMERNKIDMNQLSHQNSFITSKLDKAISKIQEKEQAAKEDKAAAATFSTNTDDSLVESLGLIPDHCPSAIEPDLIYPIISLVPEEVIECCRGSGAPALQDAMSITSSAPEDWKEFVEKYSIPTIVSTSLPSSAFPEDDAQTEERWSLAIFTISLLRFRSLSEAKLNSPTSPIPFLSDSAFSALLSKYAEQVNSNSGLKRWKCSSFTKDKLLTHLCVCLLHLKSQRVNAAELSACLSLPMSKMCEYFKAVGCKLEGPLERDGGKKFMVGKRQIAVKMAVLKAPLHIAPPSSGKRK